MRNIRFFVIASALLSITFQGCTQEPTDTSSAKVYESCCGTEPVEFTFGNAYMYVANVFTPNGDGINDYFVPSINENVLYIDTYLIYTAVGDTLLFDRMGFDFNYIPTYAWDGNRKDGTPYLGAFKYEFVAFRNDGSLFTVKGSACRVACGPDAATFQGRPGCFYPSQANVTGYLDSGLPNKESDCFK